jgi:hypothetical protein
VCVEQRGEGQEVGKGVARSACRPGFDAVGTAAMVNHGELQVDTTLIGIHLYRQHQAQQCVLPKWRVCLACLSPVFAIVREDGCLDASQSL